MIRPRTAAERDQHNKEVKGKEWEEGGEEEPEARGFPEEESWRKEGMWKLNKKKKEVSEEVSKSLSILLIIPKQSAHSRAVAFSDYHAAADSRWSQRSLPQLPLA